MQRRRHGGKRSRSLPLRQLHQILRVPVVPRRVETGVERIAAIITHEQSEEPFV